MAFEVTVMPLGKQFICEEDDTLLNAALAAGIELPYGCKNGACSACKAKVISGTVSHRAHQEKALSSLEEMQGKALLCCAEPRSNVVIEAKEVKGLAGLTIKKMPVRIKELTLLSHDVMQVTLQLPNNERLRYLPGQYLDFLLKDGKRRSYSIANAPIDAETLSLHIRHMPGGTFTDHLFSTAKVRDILRIEAPLGTFFLREDSEKPIIFIASGTGFGPIKAILEHAFLHHRHRQMTLYWGGRRLTDIYHHALCQEWMTTHSNFKFVPVLSDFQAEDNWAGRQGLVHQAVLQDVENLASYQVYACGNPMMVEAAKQDLIAQRGLPAEEFYADAFISEADLNATL